MLMFRKKPVVVEAVQIPSPGPEYAKEWKALVEWLKADGCVYAIHPDARVYIATLEGEMKAGPGDWIIKGVNGEFYPCKPDIFEKTYEPVRGETE